MDAAAPLPPGTMLDGRYEVTSVLGTGGFGITYCAYDTAEDTNIAIKEYFPQDWGERVQDGALSISDEKFAGNFSWGMQRFLEEAERLAQVLHPNIVRVKGVFRQNHTAYLLMSYEEGLTLKDWLETLETAPNQTELDLIIGPLLEALELMHAAGIYHRDISPDNIVLRLNGSPVLLDFGAAREDTGRRSQRPTAIVKPGYSPPEQYHTSMSRQGPWTDIYALGATIYRAISGRPPSQAEVRFISDSLLPAAAVATDRYRPGFLAAIDWALVLQPDDRPDSIAKWRTALFDTGPRSEPFIADGSKSALANALPPGCEIDSYCVLKVLGAGGFGITYLAQGGPQGETVALKEFFPNMLAVRTKEHFVQPASEHTREPFNWLLRKFHDEAASLARFQHPNIVRVKRLFQWNGTAYTVLEYLEGKPFQKWLSDLDRPPSQAELDAIAKPLLQALEAVHRAEILHRDISSANIMIRPDGTPVLFDFGAAKQTFAARSQTKAAVVTPGYAPFEQYLKSNDQQGAWTDIYSTAATFYEAVTGDVPPEAPARTVEDTLIPAGQAALADYERAFLKAIDWGLAMAPRDRPQSIEQWRPQLLARGPAPVRVSSRRSKAPSRQSSQARVDVAVSAAQPRAVSDSAEGAAPWFRKGQAAAMQVLETRLAAKEVPSPRQIACGIALGAVLLLCIAVSLGLTALAQLTTLLLAGAIAWLGLEPFTAQFRKQRLPEAEQVYRQMPRLNSWFVALFGVALAISLPVFLFATPPPRGRLDGLLTTTHVETFVVIVCAAGVVTLAIAIWSLVAVRGRSTLALPAFTSVLLAASAFFLVNIDSLVAVLSDGDLSRMNGMWQLACLFLAGIAIVAGIWGALGSVIVWRRWRTLEPMLNAAANEAGAHAREPRKR